MPNDPLARPSLLPDIASRSIEVPDRPQRIVAIHDINGGAQLLSLGAPVVGIAIRDEAPTRT